MYTNIYFVRHAKVDFIPDDYSRSLSQQGKKDVLRLTEIFDNYEITKVLSSPYLRAVNTVEKIALNRGLTVESINDFRERENEYVEDFVSFTKQQWDDFDYSLENGESLNQVQARGIDALKTVLDKYNGENIVIGTHGTILGTILNYYDKKHNYDFWKSMKMPDIFKLIFKGGKLESIQNIEI